MRNRNRLTMLAPPGRQHGAVLVFCLVFLAVLTMMGVSGMESTILEERMSNNMRDHNLAFQAAESALKDAESWLNSQATLPITSNNGSTVVWQKDAMDPAADGKYWWQHVNINGNWWTNNGRAISGVDAVVEQPRYIIEEFHSATSGQSIGIGGGEVTVPRIFHRITARSVGVASTTSVSLQSTFVKPYD